MVIRDLVSFSEEKYFNGAVQTEWFYDPDKAEKVANSYVFHGPKYFGVSSQDVLQNSHRLIDTASFAKLICDKLYSDTPSITNNFIMTIAGYGTGKSHLAVCLGCLFSGIQPLTSKITDNIIQADREAGMFIDQLNNKKNIVIVLNGMNNFNLDAAILKSSRLFLKTNGITDDILQGLTKSYDIAKHFVDKNYSVYQQSFEEFAEHFGVAIKGLKLKSFLIENVESSSDALRIINSVYSEVTGDSIHWDRGISAGDILSLLQDKLCGNGKPFNKILILFDEFGRYIEYAAANPAIAGDASLQQVFEAVQSANGKIIFTGFIQNELSAYLARIEKTSNIIRYVGRYSNSEKLYLSTNFETILASLLNKNESSGFSSVIDTALERYERFHSNIFEALGRWDRSTQKKGVWTIPSLYNNVILKGCYPLHPITTWLLSNASAWMQQRSTITFAAEMVANISESEIVGTWLPYVYPIDIVDSSIYNEMLNSEEKGLVQSQSCMLYRDILLKIGNKLSECELKALKSILIINVGGFNLRSKEDAIVAIRYCSNLREEDIIPALKSLEDLHGVIAFDESSNTYDLIAEASGFNEFKRIYAKYRLGTVATIDDLDSDLLKDTGLVGTVETSFAQEHSISSSEWVFEKRLVDASNIDATYIRSIQKAIEDNYTGEDPRGFLLFAYCNNNSDTAIKRISYLYKASDLKACPVIILFLDDADGAVIDALTIKKTISKFSQNDQARFQKHITGQIRSQNKKIIQALSRMMAARTQITEDGLSVFSGRLNTLCSSSFNELYSKTPPFSFDGFQNKQTTQAKKYLSNICIKLFDRTLMNIQSYQSLTQDEKNRVKSCLSVGISTSWQVFDSKCNLVHPDHPIIAEIYDRITDGIPDDTPVAMMSLFEEYMRPPYGLNINAVSLLLFYYIAERGSALYCYYGQEKLQAPHLSDKIFKGGKLQPAELKKIRIQANNNGCEDALAEACKAASNCVSIDLFPKHKRIIDTIVSQEGVSDSNQMLLAKTTIRLDTGISLLGQVNEKIQKIKSLITEAKKSFVIHKYIKVLDYFIDFTKPLSDEYEFTGSEQLIERVETIENEARALLETQYPSAIAKLKCDITQLSQVKGLYKKIAETLLQNGYDAFAKLTKEKIQTLEIELIAKQKYESQLAQVKQDIAMCSDLSMFTYVKLQETETKMNNWIWYFTSAEDLPASVRKPVIESIKNVIKSVLTQKESLIRQINECIDAISLVTTLADLQGIRKQISSLLEKKYDLEHEEQLNKHLASVQERIDAIDAFPNNLDDLYALRNKLDKQSDPVYVYELNKRMQELEASQKEWLLATINPIERSLGTYTASDCVSWIEKTELLPDYLSSHHKQLYKRTKDKVVERLHTCRIDGVVTMFNSLSPEERKECLSLLINQGHIN